MTGVQTCALPISGGGNNGYHARFWKTYLQKFATESKLEITVCHFPPGTSKWDKIEHRFFCQISLHLKAIPCVDIETIVQLIGAVSTKGGLKVIAKKDENEYDSDIKISDEKMEELNLFRHKFHGGWNYTIKPNL